MSGLNLILVILLYVLVAMAIIHVVMDNRQPAKTIAWVLVIFFVPVVGLVFYLFIGLNHRKERLVSQRSLDQLSKRTIPNFVEDYEQSTPERYKQMVDLFIRQNTALPFRVGRVDMLTDGYAFVTSLLRDIAAARHHIHISMYIIEDDPLGRLLADALTAKARSGVEVRLVYDDVGCWNVSHDFFERLRTGGIEVAPFLPVRFPAFTSKANYRNHRKLIIVDGVTGYVGGMNLALRYVKGTGEQPWRDTMLRLTGGIVYGLQRAFLIDWYFVDRTLITEHHYYPPLTASATDAAPEAAHGAATPLAQLVTSSPVSVYPAVMQGYVRAILAARHYVYIETPYFLPNEAVLFALKTAAVSGVDVRILCPLRSDARFTDWASRSYLRELHEAGAKISLYRTGFLHSKLLVSDDYLCTCGSSNVDFRSFENNFESNVFIYDEATALKMKQLFADDEQQSIPLADMPERLRPRFVKRLWESMTRLLAPLL